ncbi:DsbA family protein [Rhodoferax sp.]|uniref:DsbA family protein n=1 Tax=Rhodoferax sp. TaxID=50421 RepID=UPI0027171BBD|nr:DsbA family protein [Rhodoferax sp.]MDO9143176.1 DsbA family protein [Rhodoferax sp.]MDP3192651.1 DsbA family protein [Rhodoferax sp.]MDP3338108.1 DsbA family protein [Rhodoferax sp.]
MTTELLYFHDPMCSWCWAFRPVWTDLCNQLPRDLTVRRVVGGLAPDSDEPMSLDMRLKLKGIWQTIQERVPGTRFNFAFWDNCSPRRSTYNACRAVLVAARLSPMHEDRMIHAIQQAYYLEARNPSDIGTLVDLAVEIGLDRTLFATELSGAAVQALLLDEVTFARSAPINGFPSLVLRTPLGPHPLSLDYCDAAPILRQIETTLRNTAAG